MVSVGGLAAIINVGILFTVAIADRAISLTVRNFAASSLRNKRSAPIVHDSDTWLPNIPRSMYKYHRHPGILLTVLCTALLIASEIVTEIGVDVSQTCSPEERMGNVITKGDISGQVTIVEKGASAFLVQNLTFFDGPLKRVPAGVPRRIRGNECFSCMDKDREAYPDIVSGCSVKQASVYKAGELEIGVDASNSPFGNITLGFKQLAGGKSVLGHGDITYNGAYYAAFVFNVPSDNSTDELTYLEYFDQRHISSLIPIVNQPGKSPLWRKTMSDVQTWKIQCNFNQLSAHNFVTALGVYRTIQLENPVNPATFDDNTMRFSEMEVEDVYRAALSIKVTDDDYMEGKYFAYTTCGVYRWKFMLPISFSLGLVLCLGFVSVILSPGRGFVKNVPYNSSTWFRQAQRREGLEDEFEDLEEQRMASQYMGSMTQEMFLLEMEGDVEERVRIGFRSKGKRSKEEKEYEDSNVPRSNSTFSW